MGYIPRALRLIGRAAVNVISAVLPPMRAAETLRAHSPERVEPAAAPSPGPNPSSATAGPGDTLTWPCGGTGKCLCGTPDDVRGHSHWVLRPTD